MTSLPQWGKTSSAISQGWKVVGCASQMNIVRQHHMAARICAALYRGGVTGNSGQCCSSSSGQCEEEERWESSFPWVGKAVPHGAPHRDSCSWPKPQWFPGSLLLQPYRSPLFYHTLGMIHQIAR